MIRFISIVLLVLLTVSFAPAQVQAGEAKLSWQAPTTNEDGTPLTDLAGYKLYYSKTQGNYLAPVDVHNVLTHTITLGDGTWYFVVTAYDTSGNESAYSNEVSKTIKVSPAKPTGCTVQ